MKGTINKLKIVGITVILLIAAPLGFGGFATSFAGVAKILFVVFLILAVLLGGAVYGSAFWVFSKFLQIEPIGEVVVRGWTERTGATVLDRLHELRGFSGAAASAANIRAVIDGSDLLTGKEKVKVQDAYSMRSSPQVIGAARDQLRHPRRGAGAAGRAAQPAAHPLPPPRFALRKRPGRARSG